MKKTILLCLFIALSFIGCDDTQSGAADIPKKENIDSLIAAIKKDSSWHVRTVNYSLKDSSLIIIVNDKNSFGADNYFNKTYSLDNFQSIQEVAIYDSKKKQLGITSKRAGKLIDAFKEKYCVGKTCLPLTERIKSTMNDPSSYESDNLWVEWGGDSSIVVTASFRGKNAFGALILNKVEARMDMAGDILSVENVE